MAVSLALPSPGLNFLVYYLGQAQGLYAAEGVDLDLQVLPANTGIAALLAGQLDFTAAAGSAARATATGSPLHVVMGLIDQSDLSLLVAPEIGSVPDLRDKTIAITSVAGTPIQIGRRVVQAAGLNPDADVAFVQTQTPPQTFAALTAGGVLAAVLSPPFVGMAERAGFRVIARGRDFVRSTQGGLATTDDRIAGEREKVARTIRGSLRSIAYTLDHEDETVAFMANKWEMDPADARLTYRELSEGIVRDGQTALDVIEGELQLAGVDATGAQVVDYSILQAVLQEPAFRNTCAATASGLPRGCRTS
ncbi:MAG TPA: ABC transporter substrate-binding protein [Chloroflexota bacterium]|nr:ABC transporter substrate-binding protein [Chloroflexota bacterium]